jgi:hypothetical protein
MARHPHLSPDPPTRRAIASFTSYPDTQGAVHYLAARAFPVDTVAIRSRDMRLVELITGQKAQRKATVADSLRYTPAGLVTGSILGLFSSLPVLTTAVWLAVCGLLLSMMQPGGYDLLIDNTVAEQARALLNSPRDLPNHQATPTTCRTTTTAKRHDRPAHSISPRRADEVRTATSRPAARCDKPA